MNRTSLRVQIGALLAAVCLWYATPGASQQSALPPLGGVDELKSWFNGNRSHVKALLLLSPT